MVNTPADPARNGQPETYKIFDTWGSGAKAEEAAPKVFDVQAPQPKKSVYSTQYDDIYHSVLMGKPVAMVRPVIEAGALPALDASATTTADANRQQLVNDAIDMQASIEQVESLTKELQAMDHISRFVSPATLALLTSPNRLEQEYAVQRVSRLISAQSIIQDKLASASAEGFLTNFDFVDFAISSPQNLFLLGKQREYADRATELMYDPRISDEEFDAEFNKILTEMADQGFFTDENRFYLNDFAELFAAGTESATAKWQTLWAAVDTLTSVIPGAAVVARTGVAATQTVKTVAALKGTTSLNVIKGAINTGAQTAFSVATNPLRMVGYKTNNPNLVAEILRDSRLIDDPATSHNVLNQLTPSVVTADTMRAERWAATSSGGAFLFEQESKLLAESKSIMRFIGSSFDEDRLKVLEGKLRFDAQAAADASGNRRFLDSHLFVDSQDNMVFAEVIGTNSGATFRSRQAAQNLADNIGGEVLEYQRAGEFVVVQTKNVPSELYGNSVGELAMWAATNVDELGEGVVARFLRSPAGQTTEAGRAALLTSESVLERWSHIARKQISEVVRLNTKAEVREVDAMFEMLRDGKFADRRRAFTLNEFRNEFATHFGKPPTDAQVALYARQQEALDVESFLMADEFFKRQVSDGVVVIQNQYRVVPMKASEAPATARVYDTASGKMIQQSQLAPDQVIYKNYDPDQDIFGTRAAYVTGDDLVPRRLYHSDILARNAGGTRLYRNGEIKYWIKQNRVKTFADGSEAETAPLTIMGVKNIDEAKAAKLQINNIITDLRTRLGNKFTNADVAALRGNASVDAVVLANSKWNTSIYNVDELVKWADKSGVDLAKDFDFVAHGEKLLDNLAGGFSGMSYEKAMDMRALNPMSRRDSVLMGYGGTPNRVYKPMESMKKNTQEIIHNQAYRAYMARSINGLMKSAIRNNVVENLNDLKGLTLRQKLAKIEIRDTPGAGAKLRLERDKIRAHLDRRGLGDAQWKFAMEKLAGALYGKGYGKLSDFAADMASTNPLTALRGFAFDAKLGMFNPAQLYVQASQSINVMGVAGWTGVKGMGLYAPVRFALYNGDPAVVRWLADLVADKAGLTADQFVEMIDMFKASGRDMIGVSLAEFGSDAATASNVLGDAVGTIRAKGRFFFNEGELVARIGAWNTAYMEYLARFPGKAANTQHGKRWIMNRQDTLTQSMSGQSRIGFDKFPFGQFMSYQFRINEAIFAGTKSLGFKGKAVLTPVERARLAATHTILFGASGWGVAATAMDWYNYRYGTELDEGAYRAIRKGALDYLLSERSGVDTSLSSRLGSGDNLFQLMRDFSENNTLQMGFGPSGEVGWEAFMAVVNGASAIGKGVTSGDFEDLPSSLLRFGRMFSTGNQAYNAYTAFKVGQYLSKNNALISDDLSDREALFLSLGVPLERVEETFKFGNMQKLEKLFMANTIKQVQKAYNQYNAELNRGDFEAATETARLIALMTHSMTPQEQFILEQEARRGNIHSIEDSTVIRMMETDLRRNFGKESE